VLFITDIKYNTDIKDNQVLPINAAERRPGDVWSRGRLSAVKVWRRLGVMVATKAVQCLCTLITLLWLLGGLAPGYASDFLEGALPIGGEDLLRVPVTQWVRLSVDVEEYRPLVEYADRSSSLTRSLAILPSLQVVSPHRQFQPYLGVGLGLGLSGYTPQSAVVLLPLGIEESLVLHVGGGVTYRLGEKVALTGSARFAQFKTTDLFQRSSAPHVFQDGLDFSSYTVEFGLRWAY
jgi:hypothetical protein